MVLFVLRKMLANKWMVASLLIGVILAVAMVTTIPIYSHGILTRMLLRDLQIYQENSRVYPGSLSVSGYITLNEFGPERLDWVDDLSALVRDEVPRGLPVPTLTESEHLQQNFLRAERVGTEAASVAVSVGAMTGLMERVVPVAGRVPVPSDPADASPVIEAAIISRTAAEGRVVFGETYRLLAPRTEEPFGYPIRIVGVIEMEDPTDLFWSYSLHRHSGVLLVHPADLRRVIVHENPGRNLEASWNYTFDYQQLSSEQIAPFVRFIQQYVVAARSLGLTIRLPALRIMEQYLERERQLVMTLWVLQAPLLLMLTFYLFMVSQVLIDHERNEIALMKSRGANIGQVFQTYVILGSFLSAVGFIVGPLLGLAICRVLGASSGFLEFVQRRALRVVLTPRATLYAFVASIVSLVTILIPALGASRITIVEHKQTRARARKRPLWKVLFLDVVLIAIAGYGLYQFSVRSEILQLSGLEATDLALDPILLVMSTIFVVGVGLLFLRVYPVIVRALYRLGARSWSPAFFASLIQVGRGGGKDQFLMLFIILSIAIGVYNADAARTLNQNVEEQLRYGIGADIVLQEQWQQVDQTGAIVIPDGMGVGMGGPPEPGSSAGSTRYLEPPFRRFQELPGVAHVTPVFRATNAAGRSFAGSSFGRVALYGIVPHEFGRVAWFRD
ncbi:MAG: FtsX-like permease family protein, partial [Spirochaetaceae bacterium]